MLHNPIQESDESEVNLTPMLDVVFIMLIFFIVTASFVKEAGIEINKPDAQTAVKQKNVSILIAITESGQIWMEKRPVDVRAMRANVERLLAESPLSGVVIQADVNSRNGILVEVMDQAKQAGAPFVSISAEKI